MDEPPRIFTERKRSCVARLGLLVEPITAGRMNLVWRLFGLVLLLLWLQHMNDDSLFTFAASSAASLDALALCGLLLAAAGPSLLVLLASAVVGAWFFSDVLAAVPTLHFTADEYLVQAGLPIVAVLVSGLHLATVVRRRSEIDLATLRAELDELHARVVRIVAITTLAFAGVHKLNSDFFGPNSCAELGSRLHTWWDLPFEAPSAGPLAVVALELLVPIALLSYPRLGILVLVYLMAGLGHIGPAAFASTCVVMSLAFLDRGDIALIRRLFARRWGVIAAANLLVVALSFSTYDAPRPWLKFGLLELLLVTVACMVIGVGFARLRDTSTLRRRLVPAAIRWWRKPPRHMPGLASWLALILIVNGMTPYLGVKYRFSAAMLSNLRADHGRWNSYVIPEWVRLRESTPHVLVDWEPDGPWTPPKVKRGHHYLEDGLFMGDALTEALHNASSQRARGQLTMTYRGETVHFELPRDMLAARSWAAQRPSSVLWQEQLGPSDRPQRCIH